MSQFRSLLDKGPLLFDGAMGTELMQRGAAPGSSLEELNLTNPALVRAVHRDYIAAGAQVIETNTFGANRFRLGEHYLEMRVADVNRAGALLAVESRNASGTPVLVAGAVGPLGRAVEPIGAVKLASARRMFEEQLRALVAGGVDLLILETFTALSELELALAVARELAPDLPVIAEMSVDEESAGRADELAAGLAARLLPLGPDVIGVNCGSGPRGALAVAEHLVRAGVGVVSAMPNAGMPERVGGRLVYAASPDYFAAYTRRFLEAGVRIVGGCCGTRPAHIAAMRAVIDEAPRPVPATIPRGRRASTAGAAGMPPSRLAAQLAAGEFVTSVELRPPRGIDPAKMLAGAVTLRDAGVQYANVPDSPTARLRMGVLSCAALVQQQVGLETIAHFTTRDRNVMAIQSELMGAHALGIRNILCLRGDPPLVGDYPNATAVWDVSAVGLITILANLNRGLDANGTPVGDHASFFIGAAVNPNAENIDREIALLKRKLAAGAHFLVTQPIYDPSVLERFFAAAGESPVPVLIGLMPLVSVRHAEYLHYEVPGIVIPETLRAELAAAGENAAEFGLRMSLETLDRCRRWARGAYIIPSLGRYDLAARVVARARTLVR